MAHIGVRELRVQSWSRSQSWLVDLCRECSFLHEGPSYTVLQSCPKLGLPWNCVVACREGNPSASKCLLAHSSPQPVLELLGTEPDQPV